MSYINIKIDNSRKVELSSSSGGVTGENNSTVIRFSVPEEYASFNKYLDIYKDNGEKTQTVISLSNESEFSYTLPGELSDNLNILMQVVMKKENVVFKSYRFSLVFEEGINATSYMESEYRDSIESLFEIKADKTAVNEIRNDMLNKLPYSVFSEEMKYINERVNGKSDKSELESKADKSELESKADKSELESKADKSELSKIPVKISELVDDTKSNPINFAISADGARIAGYSDCADKDFYGNYIHLTYATKEEVGNIESVLDEIITLQNNLMGGE